MKYAVCPHNNFERSRVVLPPQQISLSDFHFFIVLKLHASNLLFVISRPFVAQ